MTRNWVKSCCGIGRRSPKKIKTASLEATIEANGNIAFDVDLYNVKSNLLKHAGEVSYSSGSQTGYKVTTHPADVARALLARGVDSGVKTP